jgi:hypothetical protein
MLLCLLPLMTRLVEVRAEQAEPKEAAAWVEDLHSLEGRLQRLAPLRIEKMCFCQSIKQFGGYVPLPETPPVFRASSKVAQGDLIQVYAEVRNFTSKREGQEIVTQLASWGEVYDYQGNKVEVDPPLEFGSKPDRSRSPRQDYFINYRFSVPRGLGDGPYTLRIYVKDLLAPKDRPPAQRSLEFRVAANVAAR